MYRLLFRSAAAALLIGIILQQGCSSAAQPDNVQSLGVPTQLQATATVLPKPDETVINFTQQEYENAVARWHAQNVLEYEITLIDSSRMVVGGKMRLRIRVDGGEPRLVEYARLSQDQPEIIPLDTLSTDDLEYLRGLSVEAMFDLLGRVFDGGLTAPSGPIFEYDVAFEPSLGYPTHVYSRIFSREGGLSPTECCLSYEVLDLKIIRGITPGMPKSGNPGL
jgi:hypothetical protein